MAESVLYVFALLVATFVGWLARGFSYVRSVHRSQLRRSAAFTRVYASEPPPGDGETVTVVLDTMSVQCLDRLNENNGTSRQDAVNAAIRDWAMLEMACNPEAI